MFCIAALLTMAAAHAAAFRDRFAGSNASGPLLVAIPALDVRLGGSPDDPGYRQNELPYRVVLSPYAIGVHEVTNAEFCAFLNEDGNVRTFGTVPAIVIDDRSDIRESGGRFVPVAGREKRPVMRVSWQGARAYCRWLSRKTSQQYDLPTAAQWEAAARAGTTTTWPWGEHDDPKKHRTRAREAGPADVGSFPPNAWGIHDMTGNVWEWTLDCHDPLFHRYAPLRDPVHLDQQCLAPEIRGGSFRDGGDMARPAFRANYWWNPSIDGIGFRVARPMESRP